MCSIHIIVDKKSLLTPTSIHRMLGATHHRGPDAASHVVHASPTHTIWIGVNRLKISDLSNAANQPMQTEDRQHTLAFNGALYNHIALRAALTQPVALRTHSDTETILYQLQENGWQTLATFNGMFALAFYSEATQTLLVARDQWGMKPLYYFDNDDFLIISSEIRAILASGLVKKSPNLTQIPHYLAFKFAQPPQTFYEHIYELEPGGIYEYSFLKGFIKISCLKLPTRIYSHLLPDSKHLITQINDNLKQVVGQYVHTDVPAGLLLSGGVDSTLLLATAQEMGVTSLPSFTITYAPDEQASVTQDHVYAQQAAKQYGASWHPIPVSFKLLDHFPAWIESIDQPVADGAAWLTYLLAQEAKKSVSILLSGAGADELFAGYNRHWAYYQYLRLYPLLKHSQLKVFSTAARFLGPHYGRLWQRALQRIQQSPEQTFVQFTAQATQLAEHLLHHTCHLNIPDVPSFTEKYLSAALHFDQTHYLMSDVLAITDRMTMQHSIEARLPYLDNSIVAMAQQVPASYLLKHGRKWLLKELLSQKGGKVYTQRKKEGFGMPFGCWLRHPAHAYLREFIQKPGLLLYEVVDYTMTVRLLQEHLHKKADHSSELWSVLVLAFWLEKEFPSYSKGITL